MEDSELRILRRIVLRLINHLGVWSQNSGVRYRCRVHHRRVMRKNYDSRVLLRIFSWALGTCPIRRLAHYHRMFFPDNRVAIMSAGQLVIRRNMQHLPSLSGLMADFEEMQALTSLLESCQSSSRESSPGISAPYVDLAETCEAVLQQIFALDSSSMSNNTAMEIADGERSGVEQSDCTITEPETQSTSLVSGAVELSNPTIEISDGETRNIDDEGNSVILGPSPRSRSSHSGIGEANSPLVSVEDDGQLSDTQGNRDQDYESEAYFASSSSSSEPDPNDDTGIWRDEPRGRLAVVLARDFVEPSTDAWNAVAHRIPRPPYLTSSSERDAHENEQSTPNEERQGESDHDEDTVHGPITSQTIGQRGDNGTCGQSIPTQERITLSANTQQQLSIQSLDASQTGGGRGIESEDNSSQGMSQSSHRSEVLPPGRRFIVVGEGTRRVRRFGVIPRRLALRVLPPSQANRDPVLYLHNAIRDIWAYVVDHANDTDLLGKSLFYCDTDSCLFINNGDNTQYEPPLGNLLGDMTNELICYGSGAYIDTFISIAPKSYAYRVLTSSGDVFECCKVKGITLKHTNALKINLKSIEHLLDLYFQDDEGSVDSSIKLNFRSIRRTHLHEVVTRDEAKTCSVVLKKRWYVSKGVSLPFGYSATS
ncbi:hypothetical protein QAD02_021787 [Eretmocerus hayati]|uniref:Uncharacterized protein n=1 Tax=Eretmocerus hayati TaxID=131215 RepID=A0ACC2PRP8_9HYME|nr:hypothetical protein QAD02_021787 [Eretmocerus hayati]